MRTACRISMTNEIQIFRFIYFRTYRLFYPWYHGFRLFSFKGWATKTLWSTLSKCSYIIQFISSTWNLCFVDPFTRTQSCVCYHTQMLKAYYMYKYKAPGEFVSSEKKKTLKMYIIMFPSHEFEIFGATLLSSRAHVCVWEIIQN